MEFSAPKRLLLWNPPVKPPGTHRIHTRHLSLRDRLARLRVSVSFHVSVWCVTLPSCCRGIATIFGLFLLHFGWIQQDVPSSRYHFPLCSPPLSHFPLINVWNRRSRVSWGGHSEWTHPLPLGDGDLLSFPSFCRVTQESEILAQLLPRFCCRVSCHSGCCQVRHSAFPAGGSRF